MTLGPKSEKRHRVPVRTHCEVWREFVQVVKERQVVEKEASMLSGGNVAGLVRSHTSRGFFWFEFAAAPPRIFSSSSARGLVTALFRTEVAQDGQRCG